MENSSAARATVDVGTVIADTYTIEALLGRGGMGSVFLAGHNRLPGKKVAIKMLHADLLDDEVLARFKREAQIATQLDHPNIVRVDDFLTLQDGTPCMLLEYLQGETLAQRLRAGPLTLAHALSIVRQIGSALSAAHRAGIVHRDLKPQNIFLVASEHDGHAIEIAKVLDFGISKIRGSQTVKTQESSLLGTPQYMAPEQATGQHTAVDERTDVFAFGAIVYEMLCGQPAFQGASIPEVVFKVVYEQPLPLTSLAPAVPPSVVDAIAMAMEKKSDKRHGNVNAFIEALTGQPISQFRMKKVPLPEGQLAQGSRIREPNDAFAQTMGSGDHKDSLAPPPQLVSAVAATVASQPGHKIVDTLHEVAPPVPAAPTRRSPLLIPGIALGGAAIAAIAVFLAMRSTDKPGPTAPLPQLADGTPKLPAPPPPPEQAHQDTHQDNTVVPVTSLVDAGVATAPIDAAKIAAPNVPNRPVANPRNPPVAKDTKVYADAEAATGLLAAAKTAYDGGDCGGAQSQARTVTRLQAPRPDQVTDAWGYVGACICELEHDQGNANAAYRKTPDGTQAAKRMVSACTRANLSLSRH